MARSVVQTRRQLDSASTLKGVVTTMKTLSAVRITQHRRAVTALEASTRTLEMAVQAVLKMEPALLGRVAESSSDSVALMVLGSDRGLCGPFNERIARHAAGLLKARAPAGEASVLVSGRRLVSRMEAAGHAASARVQPPGNVDAVDDSVAEVLTEIDRWVDAGLAGRLYLAYNRPTRGAEYESTALQVLPVDRSWLQRLQERAWPSGRLPMAVHDGYTLLQGLVRQFIAHALVRAFASSLASENAARLAAMDAAERNVDERLRQLRHAHRRARQNAVTNELLDIQAAFMATEDS